MSTTGPFNMKKYGLTSALVVLFLFTFLASGRAAQVVDRIVATVNGEIVTYQEILQHMRSMGQMPDQATAEKVASQVLDSMIDDIILRQEAERLQIAVTDSEVENEIRQLKVRRRLSDDEFNRGLRLQGMTLEQFKESTRQDIMKHRMLGYMVRRKVVVTQEEVDAYFAQNQAELGRDRIVELQILVLGDQDMAVSLREALDKGEFSFAEAVARYSEGPKEADGMLSDVHWRQLDEPWKDALRDLSVGELSSPFMIQNKWVLLKLLDRREGATQQPADVEEAVREAIMRPKLEERFQEYMRGLRSKAVIEKRL